ncbi:hypothetical protein GCM10010260_38560 [Streptomyces filipinensis]|uniref:Uncharacterized protein n=1 Tax=Streptomyces filipinensis TaxID=66887 RepID=A0A918IBU3_9ACTN|nr:hypothetical protein GCM10010260_38560 [Streptomyces filipinensis]
MDAVSMPGIDPIPSADADGDGALAWSMPGMAEERPESLPEPHAARARVSTAVAAAAARAWRVVRRRWDMGVSFQVGAVTWRGWTGDRCGTEAMGRSPQVSSRPRDAHLEQ